MNQNDIITANIRQLIPKHVWQNMDYKTLINLCKTSQQYYLICKDPNTWIFLLKRDYNVTWDPFIKHYSPRDYYELNYIFSIDTPNNRNLLFNKIRELIDTAPSDPQIFIVHHKYYHDMKIIMGKNIYEIVYKFINNSDENLLTRCKYYFLPFGIEMKNISNGIKPSNEFVNLVYDKLQHHERGKIIIPTHIKEIFNYDHNPILAEEIIDPKYTSLMYNPNKLIQQVTASIPDIMFQIFNCAKDQTGNNNLINLNDISTI